MDRGLGIAKTPLEELTRSNNYNAPRTPLRKKTRRQVEELMQGMVSIYVQ